MEERAFNFPFAIDPLEESIAYETLLALKGSTEINLEKSFPSYSSMGPVLPSGILEEKKQNGQLEEIKNLHPRVKEFIKAKWGKFSVCTQEGFHYPESLKKTDQPLKLFYYKGDIGYLESPCVSVIGSRKATEQGLKRAEKITRVLVENDFTVVSGLARGIDTKALETAINLKGRVIAVIGTPIDQCYPKENKSLQDEIVRNHLLISQVPFYKYDNESFNNKRFYFPKRNVTMSAISEASIIVEASDTSGTLSQAKAAIKQKRKLFILDSCFQKYQWPFKFEKDGAIRVKDEKDVLNHLKKS